MWSLHTHSSSFDYSSWFSIIRENEHSYKWSGYRTPASGICTPVLQHNIEVWRSHYHCKVVWQAHHIGGHSTLIFSGVVWDGVQRTFLDFSVLSILLHLFGGCRTSELKVDKVIAFSLQWDIPILLQAKLHWTYDPIWDLGMSRLSGVDWYQQERIMT